MGPVSIGRVRVAAERMFAALQAPSPRPGGRARARLPVFRHLATALEHVRHQRGPIGALADAFAVIEPQLDWKVRAGAETQGDQFRDGHANATITGPEGLEIRRDVWIGVSLMAPHTRYPDHRHPPEEIYVVLSDGQWRQASDPWHAPGIGGLCTILRTSCTRCAQRNGHCSRFGSFGQNRTFLVLRCLAWVATISVWKHEIEFGCEQVNHGFEVAD